MADHAAPAHDQVAHDEEHTTPRTYVRIAAILAVITVAEVVIYYIPAVRGVLVPVLIVLSLAKFLMVVGFFMHLKFDHRLYRFMFGAGMVLTLAVYLAMLAMVWTSNYMTPVPLV